MAKKSKQKRLGLLAPEYHFSLNPYPEMRFSSCPACKSKTGQRKLPLLIHVDPMQLIVMNYTNRYCKRCDTLIGHKDEIEHYLTGMFQQLEPEAIGNEYVIIGTVEKKAWRESMKHPKQPNEIWRHTHDFKSFEELRMTMAGWFHKDTKPPVMPPPPSEEWV